MPDNDHSRNKLPLPIKYFYSNDFNISGSTINHYWNYGPITAEQDNSLATNLN